jgi:hypothetical protein
LIRNGFLVVLLLAVALPAMAASEAWVTIDRLNRRTCPAVTCGIVGSLMFREKTTIYEERNGWARVSEYYDAFCQSGLSQFVDSGNAACTESNGIANGLFAEWVSLKYLSDTRPDDPGAGATGTYALVSGSDDYRKYSDIFAKTAAELIESGLCTELDFQNMGGWVKSKNHRDSPVYFIYCGDMIIENRLYLNAATGDVFR